MIYDKTYKEINHVFGIDPERILIDNINKIDKNYPVLDIGAGQGRNSIFLAQNGFRVDAIDTSQTAINILMEITKDYEYLITPYRSNINDFVPKLLPYSSILIFGLLQILDRQSITKLVDKVDKWTGNGSLIFLTAFSVDDFNKQEYAKKWKMVDKNSYSDENGNYRTFLDKDEILEIFNHYKIIYHWEGTGPKHSHGDGQIEQHGLIELVIEKQD